MLKYNSKKINAEFIGEKWTKINLLLDDVNPGIAMGLRRICLLDLEKTALTMDIESLESDDTEVRKLFSDIQLNISLIRIGLPEDIELIISVKNNTNAPRFIMSDDFVYPDNSKEKSGKYKGIKDYIQQGIKICSLARNCSIKLRVKSEKKSGFYGPQYIPTRDIAYKILDYIDVDIINYSGNIEEAMVSRESLEKLLSSKDSIPHKKSEFYGGKKGKKEKEIYDRRILICPDKLYLDKMEEDIKNDLADFYGYYDHVIINNKTNDGSISDTEFSQNYIAKISSTEAMPQAFRLKFMIYYEVDPEIFLRSIFDKYIEKLLSLIHTPGKMITEIVKIDQNGTICTLRKNLIYDENETIANILRYQIYELSPEITFLNMEKPHKIDNMIYVNFISDSDGLLKTAIEKTIKRLEYLRDKI